MIWVLFIGPDRHFKRLELPESRHYFDGKNPAEGALLTIWVKEFTGEKIKVAIADATGREVAKFEQPAVPGFTRINWDLRLQKDYRFEYMGDDADRFVPSGEYTATLSLKDTKVKQTFKVAIEPGLSAFGTYRTEQEPENER